MRYLNMVSKILFGRLAGEGREREEAEKASLTVKTDRVKKQGINLLVRNCDEYEEDDSGILPGKHRDISHGASCLARDFMKR